MTSEAPKAPVVPNPSLPKTIGVLNMVFGTMLILCGVCSGLQMAASMYAQSQWAKLPTDQSGLNIKVQVKDKATPSQTPSAEKAKQPESTAAKKEEKAVKTPATKEAQPAETPANESEKKPDEPASKAPPPAPSPSTAKISMVQAMNDPANGLAGLSRVTQSYLVVDIATAMVLNILMIISGAGLVMLKFWGRNLALCVAGLKIIRLVVLCIVCLMFVIPDVIEGMNKMFTKMAEMGAQQAQQVAPGSPSAPNPMQAFDDPKMRMMIVRTYGMMFAGGSVFITVVGVIYPCVTLVVLTRPKARAAFQSKRAEFTE